MESKQKVPLHDSELDDFQDLLDDKFLTFMLGQEEFGINIEFVTEIIGIHSITQLPNVADYIKGVINLRGKVYPVLDMRLRFDMEEREYDERTCIVVINVNNNRVGLIVDTVKEVIDIPKNQIDPPPTIMRNAAKEFIQGLGRISEEVKILLNTQKILFGIDLEPLAIENLS